MSRENVEVVRRATEAWNQGAYLKWKEMHHADVVVVPPEGWPEGHTNQDRDAWFAQAMRLTDSWESQRIEVDEVRAVGDHVLMVFRWITRGKVSSVDLETQMASVTEIRDGRIAYEAYFLSRQTALDAMALREQRSER